MNNMKLNVKKTMSYLGAIKTHKKAKSSRENGKKGGRPLSGVSKTCLTCGNVFYIPKWRLNQNPNRGSYCSRECQGNPRIERNKSLLIALTLTGREAVERRKLNP